MDNNHSFKQNERFQSLVQGIGKGVEIFCGHYHVDKIVELPNMRIHITPSTFFQIRDDIEDFGVDHYRIGYRLLDLSPKQLKHEVIYLNGMH
jgi:Icc protein